MKKRNWRLMLRRVLNLVFSRLVITVTLVLLQVFWLFSVFHWLDAYSTWLNGVGLALSVIMCLALIRQDSTAPELKISWMIIFMLMPVQGGLLYLLWGNKRPALGLRHRLERAETAMAHTRREDPAAVAALREQNPRAAETARYLHDYAPAPLCGDTAVKYYPDGQSMFADMLPALRGAQHSIYVESFIIGMGEMWGQIHEILRRKAAAGLDVRVIYDDAGCLSLLPHNYAEMMRADGIRAFSFNRCVPLLNLVMNNRDHRKIMVIDGKIGFTGGINLSDEYINRTSRLGHWKDTAIALRGDAVRSLTLMFLQMWDAASSKSKNEENYEQYLVPADYKLPEVYKADGFVMPYADSPLDEEQVGEQVYLDILNQAKSYVHIITPYLILDDGMKNAMAYAAKRGIDVKIIMPHIPDKWYAFAVAKTFYKDLLRAGVQIFEFTPGFVHAKSFVSDDDTAVVGTINLDYRSLYHHFENGCFMADCDAVLDIRRDMEQTLEQCREVTEKYKSGRSATLRLGQLFLRLFAELL